MTAPASSPFSFRVYDAGVVARVGPESAGFIYGHQLPADTRRWENALESLPAELTAEWPGRTFLIVELAVRRKFRRRGLGRALHAAALPRGTGPAAG